MALSLSATARQAAAAILAEDGAARGDCWAVGHPFGRDGCDATVAVVLPDEEASRTEKEISQRLNSKANA